jgi:hypothetical protein
VPPNHDSVLDEHVEPRDCWLEELESRNCIQFPWSFCEA